MHLLLYNWKILLKHMNIWLFNVFYNKVLKYFNKNSYVNRQKVEYSWLDPRLYLRVYCTFTDIPRMGLAFCYLFFVSIATIITKCQRNINTWTVFFQMGTSYNDKSADCEGRISVLEWRINNISVHKSIYIQSVKKVMKK